LADRTGQRGFSRLTSFATLSSQPLERRLPDPAITISFSMMAVRSTSGNGPNRVRRGAYVEHHIDQSTFRGLPRRHLEDFKVQDALGGEYGDLAVEIGPAGH
jgi:hypothetical protein